MKLRISPLYYWFTIFALCFVAYQQVQDLIRPNYRGGNSTVTYLLGIAPNFFPSVGIPALFVVLLPALGKKTPTNGWVFTNKHLLANAISLTGLLSWEFFQPLTSRGRFAWNDVLWTVIGAALFHVIWTITPARFKEVAEEIT